MKKNILIIGFCFFLSPVQTQTRIADSLHVLLQHAPADTGKTGRVYILTRLAREYMNTNLDTALLLSNEAFKLAKKSKDNDGLSRAANLIGTVYLRAGNYSKALEFYILKLKIEEKRNNPEMLAIALMNIAGVHQKQGNFDKAIFYTFQCDSIIDANQLDHLKLITLLNLGDMFEKSGQLDKALDYTQKAYALAVKKQDADIRGSALNNLGNIYSKQGNPVLAIRHYTDAIPFLEQAGSYGFVAESELGLARQYLLVARHDSAMFYGKRSYDLSKQYGFLNKQFDAGIFLTKLYKQNHDLRQAFVYQEDALALNDSLFSKEKIARTQFLTMEEELRQKEIAEKKAEEEHARVQKLQYLTIALALPALFFITLYLSNRKIKPKFIEFLGIVSLLLTFEFIMLLLHPQIVRITNHLPLYQLLIFAVIASILTPAHHRIEQWLLKLLTHKEKLSVLNIRIQ